MNRKQLLAASLGALVAGRATASNAQPALPNPANYATRQQTTLVLPGGGARGAYEAGAIEGLRQRAGVPDGVALPGVDVVCGTSIGSINGWFVATAQYSLLARLWQGIAGESIFRVKHRYAAVVTPSSGVITRIVTAALVTAGLTSNVTGVLDGGRVIDWLHRHVDPTVPLVMPYVFTATNLVQQRSEVFYRSNVNVPDAVRVAVNEHVREIFGKTLTAREATDAHLVPALAGSSAIPILFDPVTIVFADGAQTYIDGGVADSAPVDLARAVSNRVQLILVDPVRATDKTYPNAAAVGTAAFGIAQNRVLESTLRSAFLETRGKRLFSATVTTPAQQAFIDDVYDVDIGVIRPEAELPVDVPGFDDAAALAKTYELGRQAGLTGFRPYHPEDMTV